MFYVMLTSVVLRKYSDCVLFYHAVQVKILKFVLTHTFLVLVTAGLGHGVYRKLYTLIGVNVQKRLGTTDVDKLKSEPGPTRKAFPDL